MYIDELYFHVVWKHLNKILTSIAKRKKNCEVLYLTYLLRREVEISDAWPDYDIRSDKHDEVGSLVQSLYDSMQNNGLKEYYSNNPDSGFQLILRNMVSFPEIFYDGNEEVKVMNCYSGVDPNPVIVRCNKNRMRERKDPIPSSYHGQIHDIVDVTTEVLKSSRFFRDFASSELRDSSWAFFPDGHRIPSFSIKDSYDEIMREKESLTDGLVFDQLFKKANNITVPYEMVKDLVQDIVLTYFSRLEYNATLNQEIIDKENFMVDKLYGKSSADQACDSERVVSQLMIAHDWVRDFRKYWLASPERNFSTDDGEFRIYDYLQGGESELLFEMIPHDYYISWDLRDFFGGKTVRMIHSSEILREHNYAQVADLGDEISRLCMDKEVFMTFAQTVGTKLDNFKKKLATVVVEPKENKENKEIDSSIDSSDDTLRWAVP